MILATTTGEMYSLAKNPAEAVRMYQGTGFRFLDYSFYSVHAEGSPYLLAEDRFWKNEVEESLLTAQKLGFRFVQAHAPGINPLNKNANQESDLLAMRRSIEACKMLGISNTVLHTGCNLEMMYPQNRDAYFRHCRKFLEQLLPTAEKYGVTLCIENSAEINSGGGYFFMTPEEMNSFLESMNHPLLGVCWDIGHANLRGKSNQYKEFLELGKNLKAVHIHDNNGRSDQHLAPGLGTIDFDSIMQGLTDIHFPGPFTFEADSFFCFRKGDSPLAKSAADRKRAAVSLLYLLGKNMLETYHCFEE